jgi:glucosyl-dolichyl phosphate glucuronosyltransferase
MEKNPKSVNISVILCTFNRCESLRKALETVAASAVHHGVTWEVLVVDNNSDDQTRKVVDELSLRYPDRLRYVFEPRPGKSYALNSGVREAQGDILAFVDDDVTVAATWLENLTAPLKESRWAGSGGRILPEPGFIPPPWLALDGPDNMGGILALFDLGDRSGPLDQPPFGTNMAFRRSVFSQYGDFRTDLGPRPGSEIRNEDTEFGRRIMAAGERLWYEPSAVVYHPVPENRLKKEYFLDWWFDYGRAMVREWGLGPDVWGIPRPYLRILKIGTIGLASRVSEWMTALEPKKRFFSKCMVWKIAGQIVETRRQARRRITERNAMTQKPGR